MVEGVSRLFGWGCEVPGVVGVEERVTSVGSVLSHFSCLWGESEKSQTLRGRSFSLLRLVGLAGMLLRVRGQKTDPFPAVIDLASLDPQDGFVINGLMSGEGIGKVVSGVSDINADGIDDIAIASAKSFKETLVIFGQSRIGLDSPLNIHNLNGTYGFKVTNNARSLFGGSDINDDGTVDLIIGSGSSRTLVIFGNSNLGGNGTISPSNLNGITGFEIGGSGGRLGWSVSSGGDVNGDGIDDLLIGEEIASHNGIAKAGKAYLIFGWPHIGASGFKDVKNLTGTDGVKLYGEGGYFGHDVSIGGDYNDDGYADLLINAYLYRIGGISGKNYIVFGKSDFSGTAEIEMSNLNNSNGLSIEGGHSLANVGDFNQDGIDDFVISRGFRFSMTIAYIYFGNRDPINNTTLKERDFDQTNFLKIQFMPSIYTENLNGQYSDLDGGSDVNGDGIPDILYGTPLSDSLNRTDAGSTYVIFGGRNVGVNGTLELTSLNGTDGFLIIGERAGDQAGASVSFAGDVNDDGVDDLLIGAPYADPNNVTDAGRVYVIFGRKVGHTAPVTKAGMGAAQVTTTAKSKGTQVATTSSKESIITTDTVLLSSTEARRSSGLAIGLGVGVTAFVCSLVGGGLFYLRKKSASHTSSGSHEKEDPQAGYVSIDSALSGMQSARAEIAPNSNYDIIPSMSPNDDYNDWPSKPPEHNLENYDKVGLNTLNRKMDEYNAVKFKDAHEEYDDFPELK